MALRTTLFKGQSNVLWSAENPDGSFAPPVHVGNCPTAAINYTSEKLEHYESQTGNESLDETLNYRPKATLEMTWEDYSRKTIALVTGGEVQDIVAGVVTNEPITYLGPGRHDLSRFASAFSLLTNPVGRAFAPTADAISYQMTLSTAGGGGTKILTAAAPHQIKTGYRVNVAGLGNFFAIEASTTAIYLATTQNGLPATVAEIGGTDTQVYTVTVGADYTAYPSKGYLELTAGAFGGVPGAGILLASYTAKAHTKVRGLKNLNSRGRLIFDGVNAANNMAPFRMMFPNCNLNPAALRNIITQGQYDAFAMAADVYFSNSLNAFYEEDM